MIGNENGNVDYSNLSEKVERLHTRDECAKILRVSTWTLDTWTRAGKLPAVRLGGGKRGRVVYDPRDIRAFIEASKSAGPAGVSR